MNIPDYLKSEQARADVAKAMASEFGTQAQGFPPLRTLEIRSEGAWSVVRFFCSDMDGPGVDGKAMRVYFRPEGEGEGAGAGAGAGAGEADRFIVTDLGEAVHALRLRTGEIGMRSREPILRCDIKLASLPAAICRVMLAAYEVARL